MPNVPCDVGSVGSFLDALLPGKKHGDPSPPCLPGEIGRLDRAAERVKNGHKSEHLRKTGGPAMTAGLAQFDTLSGAICSALCIARLPLAAATKKRRGGVGVVGSLVEGGSLSRVCRALKGQTVRLSTLPPVPFIL